MEASFDWIRKQHGSIDGFLGSVGCCEPWRRTLLADGWPADGGPRPRYY
jgi:hypothetical protein